MDVVAYVRVSECVCLCSWYWTCWQWQCGFSVLVFLSHSHHHAIRIPCLCVLHILHNMNVWFGLSDWRQRRRRMLSLYTYVHVNVNVKDTHYIHEQARSHNTAKPFHKFNTDVCLYQNCSLPIFSCYFNIEKVLFPFLSFLTCSPNNRFVFLFCQLWQIKWNKTVN